jgi:threonine/homoserine/homoserine lactone efflux protein
VEALLVGMSIGLAAGVSPGPLLVLVVTTTLRSGWRAGVLAACAPLVTDVLVVVAALLFLDNVPPVVLAVLGVVGGLFVMWTGWSTLRDSRHATLTGADPRRGGVDDPDPGPSGGAAVGPYAASGTGPAVPGDPRSSLAGLRQAAIVNVLSPHPWIFWATALGPLMIATAREHPGSAVALGVGFYITLVGAKVVVALLVAGGRRRLTDPGYRRSLAAAGVLLVTAGVALVVEFAPQLR